MSDVLIAVFYSVVLMLLIYAVDRHRKYQDETERKINNWFIIKRKKV